MTTIHTSTSKSRRIGYTPSIRKRPRDDMMPHGAITMPLHRGPSADSESMKP